MLVSSKVLITSVFPLEFLCFSQLTGRDSYPAQINMLYLNISIIFGEECELQIKYLYGFLYPALTCAFYPKMSF